MYGKNWDGEADKSPGEKMKDVWRKYAMDALQKLIDEGIKFDTSESKFDTSESKFDTSES